MEPKRPPETVELVTYNILPLQSFVTRAIPMPPGTPAKPRADRPPAPDASGETSTET